MKMLDGTPICGWLIKGDPGRPCVMKPGHKSRSHRDAAFMERNREYMREYQREYRAEHREEKREYQREYRAEHREEKREYDREYNAEHREEKREYDFQRNNFNPQRRIANMNYNRKGQLGGS